MAGEFRREQVQDPLGNTSDLRQGAGLNTPVSVGGVSRPSSMNVAPVNTDTMNKLAAWGGETIRKAASKQWNKDLLEGQMAYQQGRAFDEVTSDGNKWKAEGYHVMEAQTLSSTFLAAQQNEIARVGYSLSPEEYRNQYVGRLDALIGGKDPRVQELVRKTMVGQMPSLVGQHTTANLAYSQQRTEEALVAGIDTVSRDPTAESALLAMTSPDPNGPAAGLGPDQRRAAVAKGVAYAFQNDNPGAYIKLKAAGQLSDFTPEQQAGIESARQAYMNKQRATWNADKAVKFDEFFTKVDNAEFTSPVEAAKEFLQLQSQYGIEMSAEEGHNVMTAARTGIQIDQQTTANNIETAMISGDFTEAARMAADKMGISDGEMAGFTEQFGNLLKSEGSLEGAVNTYFQEDASIPSGDSSTPEWRKENLTIVTSGDAQWEVNKAAAPAFAGLLRELEDRGYISTSSGGYNYRSIRGSNTLSEHATGNAIDINAATNGMGGNSTDMPPDIAEIAAKYGLTWGGSWSGKSYDPMHFEYIAGKSGTKSSARARAALENITGTPTARQKHDKSVAALADIRVQATQRGYEQLAPVRNDIDQAYINGGSKSDWMTARTDAYNWFGIVRSEADVNAEIAITNKIRDDAAAAQKAAAEAAEKIADKAASAAERAADKAATAAAKAAQDQLDQQAQDSAGTAIAAAETSMRAVYDDPNATLADKKAAVTQFGIARDAAMVAAGLGQTAAMRTGNNKQLLDMIESAVEADRLATANATGVSRAANDGTLGTDPTVDNVARTKWWDSQVQALQSAAQKAQAANPKMTADEMDSMVQQGMLDTMSKSGYIPEDFKARYSSTLNGPLVDKNGVPTQEAVSTISDYMAMKVINPRVANMMLDESSRAVADAIANDAGNNVNGVSFAVQQRERDGQIIPGAKDPFAFSKDPAVMDAVSTATASYFGDDKWFNFFGWRNPDAFRGITADPSQRQAFKTEIDRVVLEKYALGGGKGRPESVVKAAIADVGVRTAIIGGTPMVAPKGVDMVAETFGSGLANFGGSPGRKADMMSDPSSVDNAVRSWIVDNAGKPGSGIPVEAGKAWNEVNIPAEGILDIPGALLYAARQSMSSTVSDEERRAGIDVSPMTVNQRNGGTFLMVSIQPADGSSPVIANIPLAQAGSAWITKLQQQQP